MNRADREFAVNSALFRYGSNPESPTFGFKNRFHTNAKIQNRQPATNSGGVTTP
jgi:hypothetical protein